jgi:hypothetical protein
MCDWMVVLSLVKYVAPLPFRVGLEEDKMETLNTTTVNIKTPNKRYRSDSLLKNIGGGRRGARLWDMRRVIWKFIAIVLVCKVK